MDLELLKEIGLTDGEIKVYLALIKLGSSSTGPIVKESKVHSSKVYPILDRLIDKGLVSYIKEGKKNIFTANPPNTILSFLEEKQQKIESQKKSAQTLVQELEFYKTIEKAKTEATIFKGKKGLKEAYSLATKDLKKGDLVYEMFLPKVKKPLDLFFVNLVTNLAKKGIKHYMLFNEPCPEEKKVKNLKNIKTRIGVPQEFKSPTEVCVYGNNTIIATSGGDEHITLLIKNKAISDSFRNQFSSIWKQNVYTLTGVQGFKTIFEELLNQKEIFFLGGNWGVLKYYPDYFKEWNKRREEKKIKWFDLIDSKFMVPKEEDPTDLKYYSRRVLPEQVNSPGVLLFYGNKVVTILWKKESVFNVMESKEIAGLYRKYFDYLWQQDVFVSHGIEALTIAHEKTYQLKPGEEYLYLGIPKHQPKEHHEYWLKDHKRREKAKIKCRLLFNKDTNKAILNSRNKHKGCDARYMPTDIKTPSYMAIFRDTVMMALPKKEPVVIEINNKEIADSFKAYFEAFWKLSKKL